MEDLDDHPSQKSAMGIAGAAMQASGRRRYSSTFAHAKPFFKALVWYELYKQKSTNARIEPGKTVDVVRACALWNEGACNVLGRKARPATPGVIPYSPEDILQLATISERFDHEDVCTLENDGVCLEEQIQYGIDQSQVHRTTKYNRLSHDHGEGSTEDDANVIR